MNILINILANSQQSFINLTRISIFIVMVWIGGLKAYQYEADGIVPFVIKNQNSKYQEKMGAYYLRPKLLSVGELRPTKKKGSKRS